MNEPNTTSKPRRYNPNFDKGEHDFLMDAKRRGVEMTVYLKGEPNSQIKGTILSFGPRTIKLDDVYSGKPLLVYKSAISAIGEEPDNESDGDTP